MIDEILKSINESEITDVISGGGNGSIILVEFSSTYLLYVYCAWRLEGNDKILTGSNEPADSAEGSVSVEMKKLVGGYVRKISASDFFDLRIEFNSKKILNIFL